jgi:Glycosyltransferase family 87
VLAILCAALAGWIRGQSFRAGAWLALAICIKVIPVYLLLYPLWKRDGRALLACGIGCIAGLILIPGLAFGPTRAVEHYATYGKVFFGPLLKVSDDHSLKEEILGVNATDSIGVKNALHNWMYPDATHRPDDLATGAKAAYLLLSMVMTFLTLWPRSDSTTRIAHVFGGLIVLMTIFSPVCHSHYLLFCLPVVMSLLAQVWQHQTTVKVPWPITGCLLAFVGMMGIAYLPGLEIQKDRCAALFATLPLWGIPIAHLWRGQTLLPAFVPRSRQAV